MSERNFTIFNEAITTATSIVAVNYGKIPTGSKGITAQAIFTYGSSGTSTKAYLQTSLDGGVTWVDIASWAFTTSSSTKIYNLSARTPKTTQVTPTDGSLTDNTAVDGLIGDRIRTKYVTTGTYADSTSLKIDIQLHS